MKFRFSLICAMAVLLGSAAFASAQSTTDQTVSTGTPQSGQTSGQTSGQSKPDAQADTTNQAPAQTVTPPVQEPDPSKVKHDGGKDDVDAIGNRNMGKRGLGNWYSV